MKNAKTLVMVALFAGIGQPANGQQAAPADQQQIARDKLRAAVQEICPVSGNLLGEHGAPIKVAIGPQKEEVFLCCKGCTKGKIDPKHWATIHANFASAQAKCPVMGGKLPENPKWTIVEGKIVYVCCPPCTKKIAADPEAYLQKVDKLYTAAIQGKRSSR